MHITDFCISAVFNPRIDYQSQIDYFIYMNSKAFKHHFKSIYFLCIALLLCLRRRCVQRSDGQSPCTFNLKKNTLANGHI